MKGSLRHQVHAIFNTVTVQRSSEQTHPNPLDPDWPYPVCPTPAEGQYPIHNASSANPSLSLSEQSAAAMVPHGPVTTRLRRSEIIFGMVLVLVSLGMIVVGWVLGRSDEGASACWGYEGLVVGFVLYETLCVV